VRGGAVPDLQAADHVLEENREGAEVGVRADA
jgi:hypothetical protein